jgi:hypothetical protein
MDVNALLLRLRDLADDVVSGAASLNDVADLGAGVKDLDEWITRGGALPAGWDHAARRAAASATNGHPHDDD